VAGAVCTVLSVFAGLDKSVGARLATVGVDTAMAGLVDFDGST
jgi:hypothetical protein